MYSAYYGSFHISKVLQSWNMLKFTEPSISQICSTPKFFSFLSLLPFFLFCSHSLMSHRSLGDIQDILKPLNEGTKLPTLWETWVQSLGREDILEKEMATHSSILACKIPWMEELGRLQSMASKESDTTERLHFTSVHFRRVLGYRHCTCST